MVDFYTTHGGNLLHFPMGPGLEEQRSHDGIGHLVATGPGAFGDIDTLYAMRFKAGICLVVCVRGNTSLLIYAKDELLPNGTEIFGDQHSDLDSKR